MLGTVSVRGGIVELYTSALLKDRDFKKCASLVSDTSLAVSSVSYKMPEVPRLPLVFDLMTYFFSFSVSQEPLAQQKAEV